ncbi:uncharacterized protein [Antedon mediterranea]|uniref:uncharacterized protein isoform X2 n=1 Tax=Antedon mediterranea TaxID=105859 RepID=UPI003AF8F140
MGTGSSRKSNVIDVMQPEPTRRQHSKPCRHQQFQEIQISNVEDRQSTTSIGQSVVFRSKQNGPKENDPEQLSMLKRSGDHVKKTHQLESLSKACGSLALEAEDQSGQKSNNENSQMTQYQGATLPEFSDRQSSGPPINDAVDDNFYSGLQTLQHSYDNPWQRAGKSTQQQHRVVNAFRPQFVNKTVYRTNNSLAKEIQNMEDDDVISFETFYHQNGRTYTCINQGGYRFYMDSFDTQGHFERDGQPIKDSSLAADPLAQQSKPFSSHNQPLSDIEVSSRTVESGVDDRAGTMQHPTRGRVLTYIFEERRNIHCYFDDATGAWIKMPVSWEQHTDFIKPLLLQIKESVPTWQDKYDIIAALRQSNYDVDDTVATFYTIGDTEVMESSDRLAGVNSKLMKEKDNKIYILQTKLAELSREHEATKRRHREIVTDNDTLTAQVNSLEEQVTSLEVEVKTTNLKITSLQQERPQTARPITRMKTKIKDPVATGPVIDEAKLKKIEKQTKALDKAQRSLKNDIKSSFADLSGLLKQACDALLQMSSIGTTTNQDLEDLKILYKKECIQRKLLYNQVQELRGNIRVFCRVRFDQRTENCHKFPSDQDIVCNNAAGKKMSFKFDKIFTPESKQTEVFSEVLPIITSCVDGYNICIMAYGQTGAGKTYTMMGTPEDPGVNIRSIRELLKMCNERSKISYTLKVSMVEVYNEHVQDLLSENSKEALDIRMQGKRLTMKGLKEFKVGNEGDITEVMAIGDRNRSVASTKMNSTSSRSHLLLMLTAEGVNKISKATSFGSLTLVDLAGSERISKTEATGQRLVEAAAINKSLTSLGQVFSGLKSGALHIPYRNSKLTHLLQPSLGGDSKACLFVNVSPDEKNQSESISTLQFGSNAKQVQLGRATQNTKGP